MNLNDVFDNRKKNEKKYNNFFLSLSRQYYKRSGLDISRFNEAKTSLLDDFSLIESVHQPNFLPSLNYFAKLFAGNKIAKDSKNVFFHGFLDTDTTSEKWSTVNILPFRNKSAYLSFGFPSLRGLKKPFFLIDKPSESDFDRMVESIISAYSRGSLRYIIGGDWEVSRSQLIDILKGSYEKAENLGQLNSFICSNILAEIFDIYPFYYLFSEITSNSELCPSFLYFFDNCEIINKQISLLKGKNLKCDLNIVPLWFHCDCGLKLKILKKGESYFVSFCDSCHVTYSIDKKFIKKNLSRFSVNYLTRAFLVSQALGTDLYVVGKGAVDPTFGQYEITLQQLAKKLNLPFYNQVVLNVNFTYRSIVYQNYINELMRKKWDIKNIDLNIKNIDSQISFYKRKLLKSKSSEKKELIEKVGELSKQITFLRFNQLGKIRASFIDIILTFGVDKVNVMINDLVSHYTFSSDSRNIINLGFSKKVVTGVARD